VAKAGADAKGFGPAARPALSRGKFIHGGGKFGVNSTRKRGF